jgi:hypothetical protein
VAPAPPPPPPSDEAPVITDFRVSPKAFEASDELTPLERRKGSAIELTLSEDAEVRFRVRRKNRRPGGDSRPPTFRVFTRDLGEGANSFPFTGYLAKRPLGPRRYVLIARATDDQGRRSGRETTGFRIKP